MPGRSRTAASELSPRLAEVLLDHRGDQRDAPGTCGDGKPSVPWRTLASLASQEHDGCRGQHDVMQATAIPEEGLMGRQGYRTAAICPDGFGEAARTGRSSAVGACQDRVEQRDVGRPPLEQREALACGGGGADDPDTGAVEELEQVLVDAAPQQHDGVYRLHNAQAGFIDATLRQQKGWQVQAPASWTGRAAQLRGEVKLEAPPLGPLEPVLRPYQKDGVAWLRFLRENGFGGILADEMGLGKTLQALAFLRGTRAAGGPPVLIVCPTSLKHQWQREIERFSDREAQVIGGLRPQRSAQFTQPGFIKIMNYDTVHADLDLIARVRKEIAEGTYDSPEKWETALDRLLDRLDQH